MLRLANVGGARVTRLTRGVAPRESISVTAIDASLHVSARDSSIYVAGPGRDESHLNTTTIFRGFSE